MIQSAATGSQQLGSNWLSGLGVLGLLLFFSFTLIRPFITIAIWSVVLTVALYPVYDWMAGRLGGRRRLAALLLTILNLLIVIGPATWLTLGLIDSIRNLSEHLDLSALTLPPPPHAVKTWPIIGASIYQFWDLASTNFQAALAKTAPLLKPVGGILLGFAEGAGIGIIKFFIAIVLAGFLFSPAPSLVNAILLFSRRLASGRGEKFVQLAGATIRAVSRGVIGVSALQAFLAGVGLVAAGIPGASLITSAVLILGIIQIGPSVVLIPIVIWSWIAMDPTTAVLITDLFDPGQSAGQHSSPACHGAGFGHSDADHFDRSSGRYHFLRDHRPVSGPHRFSGDLGTACGLDQGARKRLG